MAAPFANWFPRKVVMNMSSAGTSVRALSGPAIAKTRSKIFRLIYADTGYQASWEATRAQAGVPGILVLYSGGSVADAMRTTTPFAAGRDANVQLDARRGLDQLAPVFPGLEWNGKATQSLPVLSPFFRASYMYYRVGQYTAFGGYERVPQGGVLFCGEHTSTDFQGFMEGGASEGVRAATELVRILRRTSAYEPAAGSALG